MNEKVKSMNQAIDKLRNRIERDKLRLKELERQKTDLENSDIVATVRSLDIKLEDLPNLMALIKDKGKIPKSFEELTHGTVEKQINESEEI